MKKLPDTAVLLIIDVQQGMDDPILGQRNNLDAEQNIVRLLAAWRKNGRPVFHVQHLSTCPNSPLHPSKPGVSIKDEFLSKDGEPLFQKQVNSAFIGTNLEETLRRNGHDTLVIVGLTTPHCVSTTTRMAANLGFNTLLVADATAAFESIDSQGRHYSADQIHNVSLAALDREFATILKTEELLNAII